MIPVLLYLAAYGALDVDWDVVLAVALGLGAIGTALVEHRRTSKLDDVADNLRERVTALEVVAAHRDDVIELGHAIEQLRGADRATDVGERLAALTERQVGHAERIAVLEARADHQPWKHTRRKDGKFAKPGDVAAEPDPAPNS
jgi:hypothetical protein